MSLIWLILGAATLGAIWGLVYWNTKRKQRFTKPQFSGLLLSIFVGLFAVAWSISSILEDEIQAAAMGIMIFGGTAVILFFLSLRLEQFKSSISKSRGIKIAENNEIS
ncbi:MAG: hypothetical protein APF84_14000 [Gracilibacter sp. BRH_c7a]|nr:MAG: hypothetical protein APF84_14000 [Gracilibacter sp. BRH_c7a]